MLYVTVGDKHFITRACFNNFYNGQLRRMYGDHPYTKLIKVVDTHLNKVYSNFDTNVTSRDITDADKEIIQQTEFTAATGMLILQHAASIGD